MSGLREGKSSDTLGTLQSSHDRDVLGTSLSEEGFNVVAKSEFIVKVEEFIEENSPSALAEDEFGCCVKLLPLLFLVMTWAQFPPAVS
jgi:hypothetical protein